MGLSWKHVAAVVPHLSSAVIDPLLKYHGAKKDRRAVAAANASNERLQREFAQSGIQWRVADARAAGIHPVYALNAGGAAFSPSFQPVGGGDEYRAWADIGQDVSRAARAAMDWHEREKTDVIDKVNLEIARKNNQLLDYQIIKAQRDLNPPMPVPTTGEAHPSTDLYRMSWGYGTVPSRSISEPLESSPLSVAQWELQNRFFPHFFGGPDVDTSKMGPPSAFAPWAKSWQYVPALGAFVPSPFAEGGHSPARSVYRGLRRGYKDSRKMGARTFFKMLRGGR